MLAELDNLAPAGELVHLPLGDGRLAQNAAVKENVDRHGETQFANADVHSPVPHKIFRRFLNESRQSSWHNSHSPHSNTTERFGTMAAKACRINELAATFPEMAVNS